MESDYWHSLDKKHEFGLLPKQIGISHGVGDVLKGLKSKIALGLSKVELGFMGVGRGNRYSPTGFTPGSFSKLEREDIRNLAKVNEVEVSVHASPNAGYMSGLHENTFSDEAQEKTLKEVYRAIDFAGDTTEGGPVVLHVGEYQRPLSEVALEEGDYKVINGDKKPLFKAYTEEETKAPIMLVDIESGKIEALKGDLEVFVPKENDKGEIKPDEKTGRYEFEKRGIDYYKNPENAKKIIERLKNEKDAQGKSVFNDEELKRMKDPAQLLYVDFLRKELEQVESEEKRWGKNAAEQREIQKGLLKLKADNEELKKTVGDKERLKVLFKIRLKNIGLEPKDKEIAINPELSDEFHRNPEKYLNEAIEKFDREIDYYDEAAKSYGRRRQDSIRQMKAKQPIQQYALERTTHGIATAAMRALEVEKTKNMKKPLFIAAENWAPEIYGGHPQELKNIIQESRKSMAKMLQNKGMNSQEATKIAENHIKATFDIAHANLWRQYYQGSSDDFKKWLLDQVKDLTKNGIIGHVHIADNFGYNDEHLSPGEGNVPIKEFLQHLKEIDFKGEIIAEPGGQGEGREYEAALGAWRTGRSPIYRIDSIQQSWTDIEGSYLSRMPSSGYMVGEAAARYSKDWSIWSETDLH